MSRFGFKHGLEDAVEKMARTHGVERVRENFKAGRFGPQSPAVEKWLRWHDFMAVLPTLGKMLVGAATVVGVVASCMQR